MGTTIQFKSILVAGLLILFVCCTSKSSKKDKPNKDVDTSISALPLDTSPSDVNITPGRPTYKKCFENDGLKYKTSIIIISASTKVSGHVTSEALDDGTKDTAFFKGTMDGDKMNVAFIDNPPVVGATSEWTQKPWIIKKEGVKETLLIVFNAKNYVTNKWEETTYEFSSCK